MRKCKQKRPASPRAPVPVKLSGPNATASPRKSTALPDAQLNVTVDKSTGALEPRAVAQAIGAVAAGCVGGTVKVTSKMFSDAEAQLEAEAAQQAPRGVDPVAPNGDGDGGIYMDVHEASMANGSSSDNGGTVPQSHLVLRGVSIDLALLERLSETCLSQKSIANLLGCSEDTLQRHCSGIMERGRDRRRASLLEWMWESARKGNIVMQIWLSKQHLGYKEPKTDVADSQTVMHVSVRPVP